MLLHVTEQHTIQIIIAIYTEHLFISEHKDHSKLKNCFKLSRPNDRIDTRLLGKVSSLYYYQDYSQQEIAKQLHLSRPKVSRILKQARELGIVQITVSLPNENFVDEEARLEKKYGLKEALIVDADGTAGLSNGNALKKQLGIAAAEYLSRTVGDDDIIGVTWGTTLEAMVDAMSPQPMKGVHVIQTLGGVGPPEAKAHAMDLSRRLASLMGCRLSLLPAPGIVDDADAKKALLSERRVQSTLDQFSTITTAFVGIGAIETNPVLTKENREISEELIQSIIKSDAVGDIGLSFFNEFGEKSVTDFHDNVIGMTLEELCKVDTVVGIAGGAEKFKPVLGALRGRLIDVLITDQQTAEMLLNE